VLMERLPPRLSLLGEARRLYSSGGNLRDSHGLSRSAGTAGTGSVSFSTGGGKMRPPPRRPGKPWPWNTIPDPRPADWGTGMTVCIAAHNFTRKEDQCIICVTNSMISTGDMSADGSARKIQKITPGWNGMFAGDDMSYLTPIRQSVGRYLG